MLPRLIKIKKTKIFWDFFFPKKLAKRKQRKMKMPPAAQLNMAYKVSASELKRFFAKWNALRCRKLSRGSVNLKAS
jgi:hypothetical protein